MNKHSAGPPPHLLQLRVLDDRLAVCRLDPASPVPDWVGRVGFSSVTRTLDELSVVCAAEAVPPEVAAEGGWRLLRVEGRQDFALVGVLASLVEPIARAGVSLFAVSTFDTDYLLIKADRLDEAVAALRDAGHAVDDRGASSA